MTPESLREKARSVWQDIIRGGGVACDVEDRIAAAMKEVAAEERNSATKAFLADKRELVELRAKLAAFTYATTDSPEVKEALEASESKFMPASVMTAWMHMEHLARALRAAQVKIKELEKKS